MCCNFGTTAPEMDHPKFENTNLGTCEHGMRIQIWVLVSMYENTNLGTCEHDGFHAW